MKDPNRARSLRLPNDLGAAIDEELHRRQISFTKLVIDLLEERSSTEISAPPEASSPTKNDPRHEDPVFGKETVAEEVLRRLIQLQIFNALCATDQLGYEKIVEIAAQAKDETQAELTDRN